MKGINVKHFAITKTHEPFMFFDARDINREGLISPILWCRNGEFRLVQKEIVLNLIDLAEAYNKMQGKITDPQLQIMWSQGIPISNLAGRALIGEE